MLAAWRERLPSSSSASARRSGATGTSGAASLCRPWTTGRVERWRASVFAFLRMILRIPRLFRALPRAGSKRPLRRNGMVPHQGSRRRRGAFGRNFRSSCRARRGSGAFPGRSCAGRGGRALGSRRGRGRCPETDHCQTRRGRLIYSENRPRLFYLINYSRDLIFSGSAAARSRASAPSDSCPRGPAPPETPVQRARRPARAS